SAIRAALSQAQSEAFRASCQDTQSPYGDGTAAMKMAKILADLPDRKTLLRKKVIPLFDETDNAFNPACGGD
ncbi:MAG: hypothetical protein VX126_06130, partial [Planctomycetota bacterium]|nr:hypothetical protein [Planctomycetota bacterium]